MKIIVQILFLFLGVLSLQAQELIFTQSGEVIKGYNIEIGSNAVFYSLEQKLDAPIKRISISDIMIIKYADGTKKIFDDGNEIQSSTVAKTQPAVEKPAGLATYIISDKYKKENNDYVQKYNSIELTYDSSDKKYLKKTATWFYASLGITTESILEDDNVRIVYELGTHAAPFDKNDSWKFVPGQHYLNIVMRVTVFNKTNQMIYLDLGNSFFRRGTQASPYYVPSSTSSSTGSATGGSLNLGAVTNAVGIGGAVGTLANGINTSKAKMNTTTNITYSQRIICIPPKSSNALDLQYLFPKDDVFQGITLKPLKSIAGLNLHENIPKMILANKKSLLRGSHYKFTEKTSPITFAVFINYSFTENCNQRNTINTGFYMKDLIGTFANSWSSGSFLSKYFNISDTQMGFFGTIESFYLSNRAFAIPQ